MKQLRGFALALTAGLTMALAANGQGGAGAAGNAPAAAAGGAVKQGFLERFCEGIDKCRRKICRTPAGQFLNKATAGPSALTGGIIPQFCPAMPSKEEQAKPGAEGEAAQAKADAAQAAARVNAVNYLGTLDCHWHPEAEAGLVKALRTDRSECVRLAAARALCRGCCCTKSIIEALTDCVNGKEVFGPYENSPRVQAAAMIALEHCCNCYHDVVDEDPKTDDDGKTEKPKSETPKKPDESPTGSAKPMQPLQPGQLPPVGEPIPAPKPLKYSGKPTRQQVAQARLALAQAKAQKKGDESTLFPSGQRSLYHLAQYVIDGGKQDAAPKMAMPESTQAPGFAHVSKPATMAVVTNSTSTVAPPLAPISSMAPAVLAAPPAAPAAALSVPVVVPTGSAEPAPMQEPIRKWLDTLRNAPEPEVRHGAARNLATCNWNQHPEAVMGLLYAVRNDKVPAMRVACIRCLAIMKAGTPEVVTVLQVVSRDNDEWIREEATKALSQLK